MRIFNKCHALFLGFLVFAIVGAAGYSINPGDYFQHQYTFIVVKSLLLFLSFPISLSDYQLGFYLSYC